MDVFRPWWRGFSWKRNDPDRPVFDSLMWADCVVKLLILPQKKLQVLLPKYHKMPQALILGGLHKPLCESVQVRGLPGKLFHLDAFAFENFVERPREFCISIPQKLRDLFTAILQVHDEVSRLLFDPRPVGLQVAPAMCARPGGSQERG